MSFLAIWHDVHQGAENNINIFLSYFAWTLATNIKHDSNNTVVKLDLLIETPMLRNICP